MTSYGDIPGSKPSFKVGDKVAVAKNRKHLPVHNEESIASGFAAFFGGTPPPPHLPRKLINYDRKEKPAGGRKTLEGPKAKDRREGVKILTEPDRSMDQGPRGKKYITPNESNVISGPTFAAKRRVVNPATGARCIENRSNSWEYHKLYGRLRSYGAEKGKTFSHGLFPTDPHYPPDKDPYGNTIDYALARYGGPFADRGLRTEYVEVPLDPAWSGRGQLSKGAADRRRKNVYVSKLSAMNQTGLAMRRAASQSLVGSGGGSSGGGSRPHTSAVGGSRGGGSGALRASASRGALGPVPATAPGRPTTSSIDQDATIRRLQAELNSLKARKGVA